MGLNGEKRGRRGASLLPTGPPTGRGLCAAAGAGVDVSAVFGVDPLLAHSRQLPALGHEHDDESDGCAGHQAAADADILETGQRNVTFVSIHLDIFEYFRTRE